MLSAAGRLRLCSSVRPRRTRARGMTMATPVASAATVEDPVFTQAGYRRPLHWVFKVGDLRASLDFYSRVLGMKVHRHEEFASGCEATCNGPYGGAWSKTMVGYGTEATHFALELTYNYGIPGYQLGDDLRFIALSKTALRDPSAVTRDAQGREVVVAPDGYTFLLVDAPAAANGDPFLFVSLHVRDAAAAAGFYERVLGAAALPAPAGATPGAVHVGWGAAGQSHLELVSLGRSVDRATASGRFATETEDGAPGALGAAVAGEGTGTVLHGPVVLQPHGEEVVIAQDADGHEYCFVDARGYRACTAVAARQGGTDVDWPYRARLEAAAALTGEAAKRGVAAVLAGEYDVAAMSARLDALIAQAPAVVFSQTSCPFCKKAKTLLSDLGAAYATVELDTLGAEGHALRAELGKRTGRTSVPAVFVGGQCLGGYGDGPGVGPLAEQGKLGPLLQAAGAL